ncbi:hypothetical protein HDV00_011056 [Rhizophlyctis rosea]|nr:hypothetical protein HDV00_011056 [Rhizophlyctis rosea]
MASVSSLPSHLLMDIIKYVKLQSPETHHRRYYVGVDFFLAQVSKAWRFATFKLTGDTLNSFFHHEEYTLPFGDPLRVQLLRTLSLVLNSSFDTYQRVFSQINVTNLQEVRLLEPGVWGGNRDRRIIECVANAFANAEKPLRLQKFDLESASLDQTTSFQGLLDSLQGAPLQKLSLQDLFDERSIRYHFRLNALHQKLTTLDLAQSIVLDDLTSAAPNLQSLFLLWGGDGNEGTYPMANVVLPNLRRVYWDGHNWADSLLTLPPATLSVIKELDVDMNNSDTLVSCITKVLPHTRTLESFSIAYYKMYKAGLDEDLPSLQTLVYLVSTTSPDLRRISIPVNEYDPDVLITMLQNKPSLRKVELFTDMHRRKYETSRIRAATGAEVVVRSMFGTELERPDDPVQD